MASHLGDEDTVPDTPRPPAEDMADQQQQQGSGGTTGGYVTAVLSELLMSEVESFFQAQLLPLAKAIEEETNALTYEAETIGSRGQAEHAAVEKELNRLSSLVLSFHNAIAQFLTAPAPGSNVQQQ